MKVTELNQDQLDELRQQYNYDVNDSTAIVDKTDIPNSVLYDYYDDTDFVAEDFSSYDMDEQERNFMLNWIVNEFANTMDANEFEDIMTLIDL